MLYLYLIPFQIISILSYTLLPTSLAFLETSPEVFMWECFKLFYILNIPLLGILSFRWQFSSVSE